jgi:hypothetical protein
MARKVPFPYVTLNNLLCVVPVVAFDQTFASVEYMTFAVVPLFATATNVPFPDVTDDQESGRTTEEVVQFKPSGESAAPLLVAVATKNPFPAVTDVHDGVPFATVQLIPSGDDIA